MWAKMAIISLSPRAMRVCCHERGVATAAERNEVVILDSDIETTNWKKEKKYGRI